MRPCDLTATAAQAAIRAGTLSPVELITSCIEQIERIDPTVNAMVGRAFDSALAAAAVAENAVASGATLGPLHGLPVAVKDIHATAGIATTFGAEELRDNIPSADSSIVARLRAAGAIVIGKTNVPEHSIGANTVNRLFGATGNPFDIERTCGGSSGGSAVALATNMAPLATGSDHGGSLRIPACYCGVVGFRATPGLVPNETRTIGHTTYSVPGAMARTVADVGLMLSAITRRDLQSRRDPMAFPVDSHSFTELDADVDLKQLRVGVSADFGGALVSTTVRQTFAERVAAIADNFARCDWLDVDLAAAPDVDWHLRQELMAAQYHDVAADWDDDFNPNIRASYSAALQTGMGDIASARKRQMQLFQHFASCFDDYDVILAPGVSIPPFPWQELNPAEIDGQAVTNYMAWLNLTAAITVVGHPVVALPCGLDATQMPFGLQVIGPCFNDHALLSHARAIEQMLAQQPATQRPEPDWEYLTTTPSTCATQGKLVQVEQR